MKEQLNEYIISYTGVRLERDRVAIMKRLEYLGNYGCFQLQASQNNIKYALPNLDKDEAIKVGLDITKQFTLKISLKNPNSSFIDRGDMSAHWNGIDGNWHRGCPFFFRENGQSVDLVDLYRGGSVFLLLNGPSTNDVDLSLLSVPGVFTYGVNNGAHITRPNFWSCVDSPHRFMGSIWADQTIQKYVPMSHLSKPVWDGQQECLSERRVADHPNVIGLRRNERFNAQTWLTESTINWGNHGALGGGRSVMLMALKVCYLLGFRNVFLVGCDFKMTAESGYFFKEGRTKQAIDNNTNSYMLMRGYFAQLKPYFDRAGFNVMNTTKDSALEAFPYIDFVEAAKFSVREVEPLINLSTLGMYAERKIAKKI